MYKVWWLSWQLTPADAQILAHRSLRRSFGKPSTEMLMLLLNDALIKEHPQLQRHLCNSFLDLNPSGHHHHPSWCSMLLCFSAPCLISPFCFRAAQIYVVALALPSLDHSVSTFWSRVIASSHPFILLLIWKHQHYGSPVAPQQTHQCLGDHPDLRFRGKMEIKLSHSHHNLEQHNRTKGNCHQHISRNTK